MDQRKFTQKDVALGRKVARFRKKADLSQEDLAVKSGLSQTTIGLLEVGKRRVSLKTLQKIGSALGVKVRDLLPY
jgi:transcriptional regulator with XRE-family HTH domain